MNRPDRELQLVIELGWPAAEPPAGFAARVATACRPTRGGRRRGAWVLAAAAAAVVALAPLWLTRRASDATPAGAAAAEVSPDLGGPSD